MCDEDRDCAKCGQMMAVGDGFEWPDDPEETLCWACLHADRERLREIMGKLPTDHVGNPVAPGDKLFALIDGAIEEIEIQFLRRGRYVGCYRDREALVAACVPAESVER